jgi:hypothetical protein
MLFGYCTLLYFIVHLIRPPHPPFSLSPVSEFRRVLMSLFCLLVPPATCLLLSLSLSPFFFGILQWGIQVGSMLKLSPSSSRLRLEYRFDGFLREAGILFIQSFSTKLL